jgi:hypothetical protein
MSFYEYLLLIAIVNTQLQIVSLPHFLEPREYQVCLEDGEVIVFGYVVIELDIEFTVDCGE